MTPCDTCDGLGVVLVRTGLDTDAPATCPDCVGTGDDDCKLDAIFYALECEQERLNRE